MLCIGIKVASPELKLSTPGLVVLYCTNKATPPDSHLLDDLTEGLLQFAMETRQLLVVAVVFVDGNQHPVQVAQGLEHLGLGQAKPSSL